MLFKCNIASYNARLSNRAGRAVQLLGVVKPNHFSAQRQQRSLYTHVQFWLMKLTPMARVPPKFTPKIIANSPYLQSMKSGIL